MSRQYFWACGGQVFRTIKNGLLALIAASSVLIAAMHFFHQHQSRGAPADAPSINSLQGRSLAEIPGWEFKRGATEPLHHFVARMVALVHNSTYHCLPANFALSPVENAFAWLIAQAGGSNLDWQNGPLGRDDLICGYCHQRATVLANILRENGIEARPWGLSGHVVTKYVTPEGDEYLADADYGVLPYPLAVDATTAKELYASAPWPDRTDKVVGFIVSREDNEAYYSNAYLDEVHSTRKNVYLLADVLSWFLVAICAGCGVALLPHKIDGRAINGRRSVAASLH